MIVFALLVGMLALKGLLRLSGATFASNQMLRDACGVVGLAVAMFFVFIFLQPISQFIYFQF